jgi:FkbM family methyltransferase
VSNQVATSGDWEAPIVHELMRQLHAVRASGGDAGLIDIGANIGWYSFMAAATGFPALAYEAMEVNQAAMWTTMCLNPWMHDMVTLFPYGLGPREEQCHMWALPSNFLDGHMFCGEEGAKLAQSRCLTPSGVTHIVRLADYLPAQPRDLVMKIDVEGSEPGVLRGAGTGRGSVLADRVRFATTEVNPGDLVQKGTSVTEYLGLWTSMGFDMSLVNAFGFQLTTLDAVLFAVRGTIGDVYMANTRLALA